MHPDLGVAQVLAFEPMGLNLQQASTRNRKPRI